MSEQLEPTISPTSMSSAEAILASPSPLPDRSAVQRMIGIFGRSLPESLASYDHASRCWRTSQITFLLDLEMFSETWPRSGTMRSGVCYRRPEWGSPIDESGSLYLPTPQASDGTFRMIRRPLSLRDGAYRIESNQGIDGNAKLADIAWNVWDGPLSPRYVEAMMGFPPNWLNESATPSETPSSRKSRKSSDG